MRRKPRSLVVTTALPSLAALLGAGVLEACKPGASVRTVNPPEPVEPPRPQVADAGRARLPPTPLDPEHLPLMPAGAIAPVGPMPVPSVPQALPRAAEAPAPAAAIPSAPVPSAAAAQANAEAAAAAWGAATPSAGLGALPAARPMLVHNHPPGTPCTPIARADLERAVQRPR